MSKGHPDLIERIKAVAFPLVEREGLELVDVEFRREQGGWVLRFYIDKEGGVSLADCETVSARLGNTLDMEDLIDHPYTLEVSSPGLNRPLKREADFIRFAGRLVRITTAQPVGGRHRFVGRLLGYQNGNVILEVETPRQGVSMEMIPYSAITKARLEVEL